MSTVDSTFIAQQLDLFEKQFKAWKPDRDSAAACRALEDIVGLGLSVYDSLKRFEHNWADDVRANQVTNAAIGATEIERLCRQWVKTSQNLIPPIDRLAKELFRVRSADSLRDALHETRLLISVRPPTAARPARGKTVSLAGLRKTRTAHAAQAAGDSGVFAVRHTA